MDIVKSTRHQKIIGHFGESIVCNWLSRSGFEVTIVDHTGIDVIAYNPSTRDRLGITVKSRTRASGTESDSVNIFSYQKRNNDREKVLRACNAFECIPWVAVYVETTHDADVYLTSLANYDRKYRITGKAIDDWKMGKRQRAQYEKDPNVKHVHVAFSTKAWNWP